MTFSRKELQNYFQPVNIWGAVKLFCKLYPSKSPFLWDEFQRLQVNTQKRRLWIWYVVVFFGAFLYGFVFTTSVVIHQLYDTSTNAPLVALTISILSAGAGFAVWMQALAKLTSGKGFAYGFNQLTSLQDLICTSKFKLNELFFILSQITFTIPRITCSCL